MKTDKMDDELKTILSEAKELGLEWKHGFVNYDHLFAGMLRNTCKASPYLVHCDADHWEERIRRFYPVRYEETVDRSPSLTVYTDRILSHSSRLAGINNDKKINTIHVLLAILSYDNEVSRDFSKAGILFEDIAAAHFNKSMRRVPPRLDPVRKKRFASRLSPEDKNKELSRLYRNACSLFLYEQYEDCISVCRIGLSLSPSDVCFRELLAYGYIRKLDFERALPLITELVNEKPENTDFRLWLAYVYDETGNHTAAGGILDKLLKERPYSDILLNNRGFNLCRQGKYEEAAPFFERAIQLNPGFSYPWNNLGFVTYKLGQTAKAFSLIDKSLELDRGNPIAYKHAGIIFMEQGYKEKALRHFNLALKFGYTEKYGEEVVQLMGRL